VASTPATPVAATWLVRATERAVSDDEVPASTAR